MKAVVLRQSGGMEVIEMERPRAGPGELIVRMEACGLCGTDVEKIEGGYKASKPVIGHEVAGVVVEVGEGVESFRVGDPVIPHHHVPCYSCYYCLNGSPTMCPYYREYNLDPGGFAEYFRVPSWIVSHDGVLRVPDRVTFEEASMTEPVACCVRAIERSNFREGERVVVIGCGPIGLTFVELLRRGGASVVIATDRSEFRLDAAAKRGAIPVNSSRADLRSEVMRYTEGRGADLSIVAAGNTKALEDAITAVRRGGRVCLFGVLPAGSTLDYDMSNLITREVSIISSNAATEVEMKKALEFISRGVVDADGLITHRYSLSQFGEALLTFKSLSSLKVMIRP